MHPDRSGRGSRVLLPQSNALLVGPAPTIQGKYALDRKVAFHARIPLRPAMRLRRRPKGGHLCREFEECRRENPEVLPARKPPAVPSGRYKQGIHRGQNGRLLLDGWTHRRNQAECLCHCSLQCTWEEVGHRWDWARRETPQGYGVTNDRIQGQSI